MLHEINVFPNCWAESTVIYIYIFFYRKEETVTKVNDITSSNHEGQLQKLSNALAKSLVFIGEGTV